VCDCVACSVVGSTSGLGQMDCQRPEPEACADVGFASHSERTSHTAEAWTGRCLDRMLEAIPGGSQPRHATLEENLQQPVNRGR
jgi:hypothetical protein